MRETTVGVLIGKYISGLIKLKLLKNIGLKYLGLHFLAFISQRIT